MSEIVDQINEMHRAVRAGDSATAGGATRRTVSLRRTYPAPIEDVWDACTTADRIGRWLTPVTGDLRLGGRFQLQGNAGGEILRCEPPRLLRVSWGMGDGPATEVEVRLTPGDGAETIFELEHTGITDSDLWARYGPGALGVGWDLALLGLFLYLSTKHDRPENPDAWMRSPEAREFITRSSQAWGTAYRQAGASEAEAASAVAATTAFYAPPPPSGQG